MRTKKCVSRQGEVTIQVKVSVGHIVLQSWRKRDSSHGFRVIQRPELHVISDYQPTQVLQRPWLAWGHTTNKYIVSSCLKHTLTLWIWKFFYAVCQRFHPTRASSSGCVWGWDRCWCSWHSPGASLQCCQQDVPAMTLTQTHRTERYKIRDGI